MSKKLYLIFSYIALLNFSLGSSLVVSAQQEDPSHSHIAPKFEGPSEEVFTFSLNEENRTLTWTVLEANPKATIKLTKGGKNITSKIYKQILNEYEAGTGQRIVIKLKRITYAMEGSYQCHARNEYGEAVKTLKVGFTDGNAINISSSLLLIIFGVSLILITALCVLLAVCSQQSCCRTMCCDDGSANKIEEDPQLQQQAESDGGVDVPVGASQMGDDPFYGGDTSTWGADNSGYEPPDYPIDIPQETSDE